MVAHLLVDQTVKAFILLESSDQELDYNQTYATSLNFHFRTLTCIVKC